MRNALIVTAVLIVAGVVVALYATDRGGPAGMPGGPAALAGTPAQSFEAKRLDGKTGSLNDYRGSVVLLNLWASWCTPCQQEMPDLERLYAQQAHRGFVVVGVDQGESAQTASAFARSHGLTFPILVDEGQRYGRAYAAIGLPTSLVIDRSGRVVQGFDGALTLAQMHEAVDPLLRAR